MKMASFIPCLSVSKTSHKINEHHFNIVFIINKKGLKIRYFFASQECDWKILLLHQLCHRKKLNFCCLLSEGILSILSGTTQMINISDETYFFLLQSSLFIISMILFLVLVSVEIQSLFVTCCWEQISHHHCSTAPAPDIQYYWADWRQGWTLLYYHHLKILLLSVYQRPDSEAIIFVLTPTHQLNKNNTNLEINRQKLNSKLFSLFEAIKACGWWSWEFYWMKYFRFYLKRFCQEPINYRDWILLGLNFNLF